jgi:murein DD-endopeptidase MepM/ murein hydrolase activator NlpD
MKTKLFSPLLSAANNIVKTRRPLTKRAKEYDAFINWLDTSNKDVKKIKLPKVKKVEDLEFSVGMSLGGDGGGSLNFVNILKKLGAGAAGGFGLRSLIKKIGKGKPVIKATKGSRNIFSRISTIGQKTKPTGVKAANNIVNFNRQPIKIEGGGTKVPKMGMGSILKGGATFGIGILLDQLVESGMSALDAKIIADKIQYANTLPTQKRNQYINKLKGELKKENSWQSGFGGVFDKIIALGGETQSEKRSRTISAILSGTGNAPDKMDQRLKTQEKTQREAASASNVTFVSITDKFDKVVSKFEKIKFGVSGVQNKDNANGEMEDSNSIEPTDPIDTGNKPESTGLKLEDVEASGGEVPGAPNSGFRSAHRPGHNGNDYFKSAGTPISLIQEGTVAVADMNYDPGGWGAVVEVRHRDGSLSRYAHLSKISVAAGSKITPGQVIGYTGGAAGAPGAGNSRGEHLHFEYLPAGSGQVDPTEAAKRIFRFGGNVKVKAKKGENKGPQGMADIRGNTPDTKQQTIEDFAKQTMGKERADRALKDPKLPEFKQLQKNYNVYVKGIRERRQAQIAPGQIPQVPEAITTPLQEQTPGSVILLGQPSVAPAGQSSMVPVPIPMGGGGGGVAVVSIPEGKILNSLWKTMLLTNLSSA